MRGSLAAWMVLVGACGGDDGAHAVVCVTVAEDALIDAHVADVRVLGAEGMEWAAFTPRFAQAYATGETPEALLPLRIPVAPRGGDLDRTFTVEVTLEDGAGAPLGTQSLRGGYSEGVIRGYALALDAACLTHAGCAEDEICRGGSCVALRFDEHTLGTSLDAICRAPTLGSVDGFSGAQGFGSWFYGVWDRRSDDDDAYDPDGDFRRLRWGDGRWDAEPNGFIADDGAMPHVSGSVRNVMIRRWIAPHDARLEVRFTVTYRDPPSSDRPQAELADGVIGTVWLEGERVATRGRDAVDRDPWDVFLGELQVRRGDRLDFGIDGGPVSSVYDPSSSTVTLTRLDD